jgi:hypothetical protein
LVGRFHVGRVEVRRAASSVDGRMFAKLRTGVTVRRRFSRQDAKCAKPYRELATDGHR